MVKWIPTTPLTRDEQDWVLTKQAEKAIFLASTIARYKVVYVMPKMVEKIRLNNYS
ncbi:hypothetical protein [Spiroplasma taiwanense]|uniref:hypothetical protein n=1 Tax=Spiroplasma taiwanense TaxID=2145 RepID=UPI000407384F|nr:hypothetical protein [Spiroplasma taiwanense]